MKTILGRYIFREKSGVEFIGEKVVKNRMFWFNILSN